MKASPNDIILEKRHVLKQQKLIKKGHYFGSDNNQKEKYHPEDDSEITGGFDSGNWTNDNLSEQYRRDYLENDIIWQATMFLSNIL